MNRRRFLKDSVLYSGLIGAFGWGRTAPADHPGQNVGNGVGSGETDLSDAMVVAPRALSPREHKAVQVLVEEVEKCTEFRWPVVERLAPSGHPLVVVGSENTLKPLSAHLPQGWLSPNQHLASREGYRLHAQSTSGSTLVLVAGAGERGVLFWSWGPAPKPSNGEAAG
jgi:hypothetical protein